MLKVAWNSVEQRRNWVTPRIFPFVSFDRVRDEDDRFGKRSSSSSEAKSRGTAAVVAVSTANSGRTHLAAREYICFRVSRLYAGGKREKGRWMRWLSWSSRCLRCDHRSNRATVNSGHARRGFIGAADSDNVWEEKRVPWEVRSSSPPTAEERLTGFRAPVSANCESWDDATTGAAARAAEGWSAVADATTRRGTNRPCGVFTRRSLWSLSPVTWTR